MKKNKNILNFMWCMLLYGPVMPYAYLVSPWHICYNSSEKGGVPYGTGPTADSTAHPADAPEPRAPSDEHSGIGGLCSGARPGEPYHRSGAAPLRAGSSPGSGALPPCEVAGGQRPSKSLLPALGRRGIGPAGPGGDGWRSGGIPLQFSLPPDPAARSG